MSLFAASALTADFDPDGDVDNDDLAKWQANYGGPGSDADGDNLSAGNDFIAEQPQFGSSTPTTDAVQAVPEPAAVSPLVTLIATVTVVGRGRRPRE